MNKDEEKFEAAKLYAEMVENKSDPFAFQRALAWLSNNVALPKDFAKDARP